MVLSLFLIICMFPSLICNEIVFGECRVKINGMQEVHKSFAELLEKTFELKQALNLIRTVVLGE